jgi:hypothetical protein
VGFGFEFIQIEVAGEAGLAIAEVWYNRFSLLVDH